MPHAMVYSRRHLSIQVAALFDEQLEDRSLSTVGSLLQQCGSFRIALLHTHSLRNQQPHALCLTPLAKLMQIDEDQVKLVNELLLQCMQASVVQTPHEKARGPAKLQPSSWGQAA